MFKPNATDIAAPLEQTRLKRAYLWATSKADSAYAPLWLGLIFTLELILFIPLDAILMMFCWERPQKRFLYASIAALASTLSGVIGYFIGFFLWDAVGPFLLSHLISEDFFQKICGYYASHEMLAVGIGCFLPMPFKAITLSAGVCALSFGTYLLAIFVSRLVRFGLVAQLMALFGPALKGFVEKHLHRIAWLLLAKVAIGCTLLWILS